MVSAHAAYTVIKAPTACAVGAFYLVFSRRIAKSLMPAMGAAEEAAVAYVDGDHAAVQRWVKGLAALGTAVVPFGEYPAGEQRDGGDKDDGRNGDHVPGGFITLKKPMHLARGQREDQAKCRNIAKKQAFHTASP